MTSVMSILPLFSGFIEGVERLTGMGHEHIDHGGVVGEMVDDVASMLRLIIDARFDGAGDAGDGGLLQVVYGRRDACWRVVVSL